MSKVLRIMSGTWEVLKKSVYHYFCCCYFYFYPPHWQPLSGR